MRQAVDNWLEKLPLAEKAEDIEALLPYRLRPQDVQAPSATTASPPPDALP